MTSFRVFFEQTLYNCNLYINYTNNKIRKTIHKVKFLTTHLALQHIVYKALVESIILVFVYIVPHIIQILELYMLHRNGFKNYYEKI